MLQIYEVEHDVWRQCLQSSQQFFNGANAVPFDAIVGGLFLVPILGMVAGLRQRHQKPDAMMRIQSAERWRLFASQMCQQSPRQFALWADQKDANRLVGRDFVSSIQQVWVAPHQALEQSVRITACPLKICGLIVSSLWERFYQ